MYIYIYTSRRIRNCASVLRVCFFGPSESSTIYNINCCSAILWHLNFGEKTGSQNPLHCDQPCKYGVYQTWIRLFFSTPIAGLAIHQPGSRLRQQVASVALIAPLLARQVQHDIFVMPCFCLQIARHNFLAKFQRESIFPVCTWSTPSRPRVTSWQRSIKSVVTRALLPPPHPNPTPTPKKTFLLVRK